MTDTLVEPCSRTRTRSAPLPGHSTKSWRRGYHQHTWAGVSDVCPNTYRQSSLCFAKNCVFTAALTYLDANCKYSCMHLKWNEMQILKRGWCSLGLGCPWSLCKLSACPPSHLGLFGRPIAHRWHAQPGKPSYVPTLQVFKKHADMALQDMV